MAEESEDRREQGESRYLVQYLNLTTLQVDNFAEVVLPSSEWSLVTRAEHHKSQSQIMVLSHRSDVTIDDIEAQLRAERKRDEGEDTLTEEGRHPE